MLSGIPEIRPDERRATIVSFLLLLGIMSGHTMIETARDALFLARIPATQLAWVYLAIAAVAVGISYVQARFTSGVENQRGLAAWLLFAALLTAAFWFAAGDAGAWIFYLLYVWSGVFATLVIVRFWTVVGELFDVSQAKRVFSFIGVGSVLGAIFGSALARLLLTSMESRQLLLAAAAVLLLTATLPIGFFPAPARSSPRRRTRRSEPPMRMRTTLATVWDHAYLRRIALLVVCSTVALTLVDFVFKYTAAEFVPAGDLASFFATTYLGFNALSLVAQLFLVGWLVRAFGVYGVLSVLPALLLLGGVGVVLGGGLAGALVLKAFDGSLRYSLHKTATEVLYVPLASELRNRVKGFIDVTGQRGGQAIASALILIIGLIGPVPLISGLLIVVLAGLWIQIARSLRAPYLEVFRETLQSVSLDTRMQFPELDLASLETLIAALNSTNDDEVIATMELLQAQERVRLIPALILYHPSSRVVACALEIFARSGRDDFLPIAMRLLDHSSNEVRAATLRTLAWVSPQPDVYKRFAWDDSPIVRATARIGLFSYGGSTARLVQSEIEETAESGSPEEKLALAEAIRYSPGAAYRDILIGLAASPEVPTRIATARAMQEIRSPAFIPSLLEMLPDRETRLEARRALVLLGKTGLDELNVALHDLQIERRIRRHIPRTIAQFPPRDAAPLLMEHLPHERDGAVRYRVLRALGYLRTVDSELPLDAGVLETALRGTLEEIYRLIHWQSLLAASARKNPEQRTSVRAMIVDLIAHKETLAIERMFRLLGLLYPAEDFRTLYRGVVSRDRELRASSTELLENQLGPAWREPILAILDDVPNEQKLTRAGPYHEPIATDFESVMQSLLQRGGQAMRSLVAYHIGELRLVRMRDTLEELPYDFTGPVGRSVRRALALLAEADEGDLQRA